MGPIHIKLLALDLVLMVTNKSAHGMDWGIYQRVGDNWRIGTTKVGGCLERITNIDDITSDFLVKFGNDFGPEFIHPHKLPHPNWHFLDNPEIPQLLNPNPANPAGLKTFVRFPRGLFTVQQNSRPDARRLSEYIESVAPGTTLENIIRPIPVRTRNTKRVLLCPSTPNCHQYYYGISQREWINRWQGWCEHNGYTAVVRKKPERPQRVRDPMSRLYEHLVIEDYFCTISQHSVAAIESIMAGVPAVVTGPHPAGDLATDQKEFVLGQLRIPDVNQVWNWILRIASNTYHKSELFQGKWR